MDFIVHDLTKRSIPTFNYLLLQSRITTTVWKVKGDGIKTNIGTPGITILRCEVINIFSLRIPC